METIELVQFVRHTDHLMVPNTREARENGKISPNCQYWKGDEHTFVHVIDPLRLLVRLLGRPCMHLRVSKLLTSTGNYRRWFYLVDCSA